MKSPAASQSERRSAALTGVIQLTSRTFLARFTGLAANVVLARVLVPEEFGRAAVAVSLVNIAVFFLDFGLSAAILRQPEEPGLPLLRALSSLQLAFTVAACAVIVPLVINRPSGSLTLVALCILPLLSLQTPIVVMAERSLDFGKISRSELIGTLLSQVATVGLALGGAGVWALLIGTIVKPLAGGIYLYTGADKRYLVPTWHIRPALSLVRVALQFQLLPVSIVIRDQGITLIAAASLGSSSLGVWVLVGRLLSIPSALFAILGRVAYPTIASMSRENDVDLGLIDRAVRRLALASAWLLAMVCAGSIGAVPLIFGAQWRPAVPALFIICPSLLAITALSTPALPLLIMGGKSAQATSGVIIHAMAAWAFLSLAPAGDTVTTIAIAGSVGSFLELAVLIYLVHRRGLSWWRTVRNLAHALGIWATAAASGALIASISSPIVTCVAAPAGCLAVLIVLSAVTARRDVAFVLDEIRARRGARPSLPAAL